MNTSPRRFPIFGILSLAAGVAAGMLFCWLFNPPAFVQNDQTGRGLFWCEAGMAACIAIAFLLGVAALVRRERFSGVALASSLLVALAVFGLITLVMMLLSQHMMGQ
ncbi:MAG: hypothetical protein ACLPRE_07815 [Limisphaerales bacterium]